LAAVVAAAEVRMVAFLPWVEAAVLFQYLRISHFRLVARSIIPLERLEPERLQQIRQAAAEPTLGLISIRQRIHHQTLLQHLIRLGFWRKQEQEAALLRRLFWERAALRHLVMA
jgi:hypothetical protein